MHDGFAKNKESAAGTQDIGSAKDKEIMGRCLELARRAIGRTTPNPVVGSIVVSSRGKVVGEGFHQRAGKAHAEVIALEMAGDKALNGTLYVSLEPCCHTGKTPPCTEAVIKSRVRKVVVGTSDPYHEVAGGGIKALRAAGIEVVVGVLEEECRWINRGFFKHATTGKPWVSVKIAATLDGRIADRFGSSQWITGEEARLYVHQLRNEIDCILVGGRTARMDNPQLNVRGIRDSRDPKRAVVDTDLQLKPDSKICERASGGQTTLFCSEKAATEKGSSFGAHVKIVALPPDPRGQGAIDLAALFDSLGKDGVQTVLCEGGGRLIGLLMQEGFVDEVLWFIAPKILGDSQAVSAISDPYPVPLADLTEMKLVDVRKIGDDLLYHATVKKPTTIKRDLSGHKY